MAYCTVAELKTHAGISSSDYDTVLTNCITYAQSYIERQTDRTFECSSDQESTRYFDTPNDAYLYFDEDICSITSIANGDATAVASSDYVTHPQNETAIDNIQLLDSSDVDWTDSADGDVEDAIAVTGKWSYSVTAPSNIVYATIRLALHIFRTRTNETDANRIVMLESGGYLMPVGIPRDVAEIIESYSPIMLEIV